MADIKIDSTRIMNLPISDIFVDPTWNTRSGIGEGASGGSDDENSDEGLLLSIKARGQDEEVLVRPTPKEYKVKQPYMLVYGYRRLWAISKIAAEAGNKNPTIKAKAEEMTEAEARSRNLRENTGRENLDACDVCFGIARILEADPQKPGTQIAQEVGLSQPYVAKHLRIITGLKKSLLQKWRDSVGKKPSVDAMVKLAAAEKGEQEAGFNALVGKEGEGSDNKGPNAWKDSSKAKAVKVGAFLGLLARENLIHLDEESFFIDALPFYTKVSGGKGNKTATDRELQAWAAAAYEAFVNARDKDDDTSGATAEEVKAKKNGKKGATVSAN